MPESSGEGNITTGSQNLASSTDGSPRINVGNLPDRAVSLPSVSRINQSRRLARVRSMLKGR